MSNSNSLNDNSYRISHLTNSSNFTTEEYTQSNSPEFEFQNSNTCSLDNNIRNEVLLSEREFNRQTKLDKKNLDNLLKLNLLVYFFIVASIMLFIFYSSDVYHANYKNPPYTYEMSFSLIKIKVDSSHYNNSCICYYPEIRCTNYTDKSVHLSCSNSEMDLNLEYPFDCDGVKELSFPGIIVYNLYIFNSY